MSHSNYFLQFFIITLVNRTNDREKKLIVDVIYPFKNISPQILASTLKLDYCISRMTKVSYCGYFDSQCTIFSTLIWVSNHAVEKIIAWTNLMQEGNSISCVSIDQMLLASMKCSLIYLKMCESNIRFTIGIYEFFSQSRKISVERNEVIFFLSKMNF